MRILLSKNGSQRSAANRSAGRSEGNSSPSGATPSSSTNDASSSATSSSTPTYEQQGGTPSSAEGGTAEPSCTQVASTSGVTEGASAQRHQSGTHHCAHHVHPHRQQHHHQHHARRSVDRASPSSPTGWALDLETMCSSAATTGGAGKRKKRSKRKQNRRMCSVGAGSSTSSGPRMGERDDREFEEALFRKHGYKIKPMAEDGNCLFRSVADQIYGDAGMHGQIRMLCMNFLEANRDHYSQYVTEDFDDYIHRKRQNGVFGNNLEIQAISEMFNRPIEIFAHQTVPLNVFHGQYDTADPPIRLSYHYGNHYNSVVDPSTPTIGVGLGLPSLEPGHRAQRANYLHSLQLADRNAVDTAVALSEQEQIDKALLKDAERMAEEENIERELELQAIRESEREFYGFPEDVDRMAIEQELESAVLAESLREYYRSHTG